MGALLPVPYSALEFPPGVRTPPRRCDQRPLLRRGLHRQIAPGHLVLTGPNLPHNWVSDLAEGTSVPLRGRILEFNEQLFGEAAHVLPELSSLLPVLELSRRGVLFTPETAATVGPMIKELLGATEIRRIELFLFILGVLSRVHGSRAMTSDAYYPDPSGFMATGINESLGTDAQPWLGWWPDILNRSATQSRSTNELSCSRCASARRGSTPALASLNLGQLQTGSLLSRFASNPCRIATRRCRARAESCRLPMEAGWGVIARLWIPVCPDRRALIEANP